MSQSRGVRSRRALQRSMVDARSGEVVFLSHCLLNQNTRYLGGAACRGVVRAIAEPYLRNGTGIVQMPCPEQRVWGGVLKTRMLWLIEHPRLSRAASLLWPVVRRYVRWRYGRLARAVAADVGDYLDSGLAVVGVVGVAGSPSCGAQTTLDVKRATAALAHRSSDPPTAEWMNTVVVEPAVCPGRGLFVAELTRAMARRGLEVPMLEELLPSPVNMDH